MSDTPVETPEELSFFDVANLFIEVANRLLEDETRDLSEIASAFRYAAARFTAHETALRLQAYLNSNVPGFPGAEEAKTELVGKFAEQFQTMLDENLTEHFEAASQAQEEEA